MDKDNNVLINEIRDLEYQKLYLKNQIYYIYKTINNPKYRIGAIKSLKLRLEKIKLDKEYKKLCALLNSRYDELQSIEVTNKILEKKRYSK